MLFQLVPLLCWNTFDSHWEQILGMEPLRILEDVSFYCSILRTVHPPMANGNLTAPQIRTHYRATSRICVLQRDRRHTKTCYLTQGHNSLKLQALLLIISVHCGPLAVVNDVLEAVDFGPWYGNHSPINKPDTIFQGFHPFWNCHRVPCYVLP